MGKATILPSGARNLSPGQYRVRIEKDNTKSAQETKRIDSEITALDVALPGVYSNYNDAQKAYGNAKSDLDEIIHQSKESPGIDYSSKVSSATSAERLAYNNVARSKSRYQVAKLKQQSLQGKKFYLDNNTTEDIRTVWCADCQRGLAGEIATIEIPNTDDTILIRPGGANGSGSNYSAARDGQLRSIAAMSPAETAWNYIMLPGWQKFKPLYRIGKVTARTPHNSKCSVLLDAYSTAQGLATDVERHLTNVPMIYKNRDDGGPYVIGDRVVIEFYNQNWEAPRVVGFEEHPCTTTTPPPDVSGIFRLAWDGDLYKFIGWTNEVFEIQPSTIGDEDSEWGASCLGPDGMIAAEAHIYNNLYQFSGVTTIIDSVIGSPGAKRYHALSYDPTTGNLISTEHNLDVPFEWGYMRPWVNIHDGISTSIGSVVDCSTSEPDATGGTVMIYGACVYAGSLILTVWYVSIATGLPTTKLWRTIGYTNVIQNILVDYTHLLPSIPGGVFPYDGGFVVDIIGSRTMIKYEIAPSGPGLVITDLPDIAWAGGGGYSD